MGTLSIRDEILERIEKIANREQVPLNQQAEELLTESIERREKSRDLRQLMDAVAAMTPKHVEQTDAVVLLREDRSR